MKHPKDLTGLFFGGLEVISYAGKDKWRKDRWFCLCGCGTKKTVSRSSLINGSTKSCGCFKREKDSVWARERYEAERKSICGFWQRHGYIPAVNLDDALDDLEAIS